MYKITLYDCCCSPICDGVASFYTDSLEDFESKWLPRMEKTEPETVERYFRSKGGEIVTDYYSDDPSLNIVQEDSSAEVLEEQSFEEKALDITLHNFYSWPGEFHIDSLKYTLRKIRFKDEIIFAAKYSIKGISTYLTMDGKKHRVQVLVCGNPILETDFQSPNWKTAAEHQLPAEEFADDRIESYVWITMGIDDIHRLNEEELDIMMRDIPGEDG